MYPSANNCYRYYFSCSDAVMDVLLKFCRQRKRYFHCYLQTALKGKLKMTVTLVFLTFIR
jgi:Late expression factor 8 (LEF-8).